MSAAAIIEVTFTDAGTGKEFLKLKLPLRGIPQRDATWTLGKDDWLVVDSTPARPEEIVKSGKVSLVLRKVQFVDANAILFSLPTVADVIPEEEVEGGSLENALRLHEDDWLQLELVPGEVLPELQADLEAVQAVLAHERQGAGFKRLHIRKARALQFDLTLSELRARYGAQRPVAYRGASSPLKDCFTFTLPSGAAIYGQAHDDQIVALGLTTHDDDAAKGLTLIDWCAGAARSKPA